LVNPPRSSAVAPGHPARGRSPPSRQEGPPTQSTLCRESSSPARPKLNEAQYNKGRQGTRCGPDYYLSHDTSGRLDASYKALIRVELFKRAQALEVWWRPDGEMLTPEFVGHVYSMAPGGRFHSCSECILGGIVASYGASEMPGRCRGPRQQVTATRRKSSKKGSLALWGRPKFPRESNFDHREKRLNPRTIRTRATCVRTSTYLPEPLRVPGRVRFSPSIGADGIRCAIVN
jgi:hypothetical protein